MSNTAEPVTPAVAKALLAALRALQVVERVDPYRSALLRLQLLDLKRGLRRGAVSERQFCAQLAELTTEIVPA